MNYMGQVAKMLGVDIGERFSIRGYDGILSKPVFYLCDDGLSSDASKDTVTLDTLLSGILSGEIDVEKKPWKPKHGEIFWRYHFNEDCVSQAIFIQNNDYDILLWKIGNSYKTKEEAEADTPKWKAFFDSEEQVDVLGGVTYE